MNFFFLSAILLRSGQANMRTHTTAAHRLLSLAAAESGHVSNERLLSLLALFLAHTLRDRHQTDTRVGCMP